MSLGITNASLVSFLPNSGLVLSEDCTTVTIPDDKEASPSAAVGEAVLIEGTHYFTFLVSANAYRHVAVGVADVSSKNKSPGAKAYGYHIGKDKVVKSPDSQWIKDDKVLRRPINSSRAKPTKKEGPVEVTIMVDMDRRRLAVGLAGETPVMTSYKLPAAVRPWAWMYWKGDSVSIKEYSTDGETPLTPLLLTPATTDRTLDLYLPPATGSAWVPGESISEEPHLEGTETESAESSDHPASDALKEAEAVVAAANEAMTKAREAEAREVAAHKGDSTPVKGEGEAFPWFGSMAGMFSQRREDQLSA